MLKILNEEYFLDFDRIEDYINIPKTKEVVESEEDDDLDDATQQISIVKYETIKMMLEVHCMTINLIML